MTPAQAVGTLIGGVLGRVTGYLLLRKLGAPRWAAYGITIVLGTLDGTREHSSVRRAWKVLTEPSGLHNDG